MTLRGKMRQIRKAEPYASSKTCCGRGTVAYDFTLEDDTASIEISVPCSCYGEIAIHDAQTIIAIVSIRIVDRDGVKPVAVRAAHKIFPSAP